MTPMLLLLSSGTSLEDRSSFVQKKFSWDNRSTLKKFAEADGILTLKLDRLPEEKNLAHRRVASAFNAWDQAGSLSLNLVRAATIWMLCFCSCDWACHALSSISAWKNSFSSRNSYTPTTWSTWALWCIGCCQALWTLVAWSTWVSSARTTWPWTLGAICSPRTWTTT
jgi:hypothetical protein